MDGLSYKGVISGDNGNGITPLAERSEPICNILGFEDVDKLDYGLNLLIDPSRCRFDDLRSEKFIKIPARLLEQKTESVA